MRIACIDLLFSWPPHGGADVDLFHVLQGLMALGHEVQLCGVSTEAAWERGRFDPAALPFPAQRLSIDPRNFRPDRLPNQIREQVDLWRPEAVIVADGFFMKPHVIGALADYPVAVRYYAHELACPRSMLRYKDGAPCPNEYARTPDLCRACALEGLKPALRQSIVTAWTEEYLAARAYAPDYYALQRSALRGAACAIVSNVDMAAEAAPYFEKAFIVPGGVDLEQFPVAPPPERKPGMPKALFMSGRAEDPTKGLSMLLNAGERLAAHRQDFEIRATVPRDWAAPAWFKPLGWLGREQVRAEYAHADCCVVPSLWEEPFGLVAVEAMATGRPVCASRVGGLKDIVVHGETGFLFERGDSTALAECLERLLDDEELCRRMGEAGRRRAEACYSWPQVVETHYPPILEHLASWKGR